MPNFTTYFVLWGVLALIVVVLAIYRKGLASKEDDTLHLVEGDAAVSQQSTLARQLAAVDKWGKLLTVVAVITGLALACLYLWAVWNDQSRLIVQ